MSYNTFDIYLPECLLSKVWISLFTILSAICFLSTPATSSPTLIIINLAAYKENPFPAKAIIIKIGITQDKVVFFSIKIFFTAGSNNHAIAEVLPATIIDSNKAKAYEDRKEMKKELTEFIDKCNTYELQRMYSEFKRLRREG